MEHKIVSMEIPSGPVKVHRSENGYKEPCCLCGCDTALWHEEKDVALCLDCASRVTPAQVPSKRAWLSALGIELPFNWGYEHRSKYYLKVQATRMLPVFAFRREEEAA